MNNSDLNEYEFLKMPVSQQRLTMFKNQREIMAHVKTTNGKVKKHEKELIAIKVVGICILVWVGIATGTGLPCLPGL